MTAREILEDLSLEQRKLLFTNQVESNDSEKQTNGKPDHTPSPASLLPPSRSRLWKQSTSQICRRSANSQLQPIAGSAVILRHTPGRRYSCSAAEGAVEQNYNFSEEHVARTLVLEERDEIKNEEAIRLGRLMIWEKNRRSDKVAKLESKVIFYLFKKS